MSANLLTALLVRAENLDAEAAGMERHRIKRRIDAFGVTRDPRWLRFLAREYRALAEVAESGDTQVMTPEQAAGLEAV